MKTFLNYAKYVVLGLVLGALLMAGYRFFLARNPQTPSLAGTQVQEEYAPPKKLIIPAIQVNANVIPVGVNDKGEMDVAHNQFDVAWYEPGPRPGMPGNAVMAGHLDTKLTPEAVFYNLDKLKSGDEVDITASDGTTIKFKVSEIRTYPYDASTGDIFTTGGPARIALVTCTGTWLKDKKVYSERLIVFADKV